MLRLLLTGLEQWCLDTSRGWWVKTWGGHGELQECSELADNGLVLMDGGSDEVSLITQKHRKQHAAVQTCWHFYSLRLKEQITTSVKDLTSSKELKTSAEWCDEEADLHHIRTWNKQNVWRLKAAQIKKLSGPLNQMELDASSETGCNCIFCSSSVSIINRHPRGCGCISCSKTSDSVFEARRVI